MKPKYIVLIAEDVFRLTEMVNGRLKDGFIPAGGVTYRAKIPESFSAEYYQAMFKPEPEAF